MVKGILASAAMLMAISSAAQYAPQAGITGSTAIPASAAAITGWASHCSVQRGYVDIAIPSAGPVTAGDAANGAGAADGNIVSLGDGGMAVLKFPGTLFDGPGADFCVFENGFADPANPAMAFLELAFVEVSSDGLNYTRFPAHSLTPANTQVPGSGVYMDASLINNLAGKYISMYGTPFDLAELKDAPGLDVNAITHVKLVDVSGIIAGPSSYDTAGNVINDPYPTNFPTGGFDLDAVAAIHINPSSATLTNAENTAPALYPNPASDKLFINNPDNKMSISILTTTGQLIYTLSANKGINTISLADYPAGIYYVSLRSENGKSWVRKISKY